MSAEIDVLIPACDRPAALAVVLACLAGQTLRGFRVIVSDQSHGDGVLATPELAALERYFRARGIGLAVLRHLPRRGMAEQRAFLLAQATARYCLFLDDDVIVEPDLLARLLQTIKRVNSGFVASPPQRGAPAAEEAPASVLMRQPQLSAAIDQFDLADDPDLVMGHTRSHRAAWIGGCVLFNTDKLRASGGFDFWRQLPAEHRREDVLAQMKVTQQFGGCAMLPSGAHDMALPTTLPE